MRRDQRGLSFIWWGVFCLFVAGPLLTLGVELGRYARAAGEVQKACDLAALAAAREVDVVAYRDEGTVQFLPGARAIAQQYTAANVELLDRYGIAVNVSGLSFDSDTLEVKLTGDADVSALFPEWLPPIIIQKTGTAQAKFR